MAAGPPVAQRAPRGERLRRRADGRSAVRRWASTRRTSGRTGSSFAPTRTSGRRPTRASERDRTGGCRSMTGRRSSATTSPGSRRGRCGPASSTAPTGSTTPSASIGPIFVRPTAEQAASARPRSASQMALGERIMRIMSRWGEVVAEDLGRGAAVLATVAATRSACPAIACCAGNSDEERLP